MNQAAQHLPAGEKCDVEVVVHIKNDPGEDQQDLVISTLVQTNGARATEFCGMHKHLVLAKYDKELMSSQDVLKGFNSSNLEAKLIASV